MNSNSINSQNSQSKEKECKLNISHSVYPESTPDFNTFWSNLKNRIKPHIEEKERIKIEKPLGFFKIPHYDNKFLKKFFEL